jgi:glucose-1-phosphate adenylyltransferase
MVAQPNILAFVMAGGAGNRLRPLTAELPKPALRFGGSHRIVDFVLSNLHHSQVQKVYVLVQYRPRVLLEHIAFNWAMLPRQPGGFVAPVLPSARRGSAATFRGTADAVYQCLDLVERHAPDLVAVFAADHVCRMDVRQMVDFHRERGADATVAAVPVPVASASDFGILCADGGQRIRDFQEKPRHATPMPGNPQFAYASMGNYLFHPAVLEQALRAAAERGETDFGQHVLPRLIHERKVYAYDFARNRVPATSPHEEPAYWRDVGSIESYVAAHLDMLGPAPRFRLDNSQWPILCGGAERSFPDSQTHDSILGPDSVVTGATVRNSVLQRGVVLEPGVRIEDCIIMDEATIRRGARLRSALVGSRSVIGPGARIGYHRDYDGKRFTVTSAGTIVIPPSLAGDGVAQRYAARAA